LADFPPSDSSPGPTYRRGDEGAAPVLDLHSAGTRCRTLSTDALSRKRGGSRSFFAFSAFNAFAQPMLTSSLCSLRHAIILPPPEETPGHILSASALQRARGAAALAV